MDKRSFFYGAWHMPAGVTRWATGCSGGGARALRLLRDLSASVQAGTRWLNVSLSLAAGNSAACTSAPGKSG